MLSTIQTSIDLVDLSLFQWSTFMKSSNKWMCNFMNEEFGMGYKFRKMTLVGSRVHRHALLSVQQIRSLYLNVIEKEDVWDTKNAFRNQVNYLILRENFKCETMEELETAVIMYIKEWIAQVNPKPQYVDGPWKAYVKRFSGMNTATTDIMQ